MVITKWNISGSILDSEVFRYFESVPGSSSVREYDLSSYGFIGDFHVIDDALFFSC